MPQQMGVDRAVAYREAKLWNDIVLQLFPHASHIEFFVFHRFRPKWDREVDNKKRVEEFCLSVVGAQLAAPAAPQALLGAVPRGSRP